MEEPQIDPSKLAPDVSLTGGVIDPGSLREVKIEMPPPPRSYPAGVSSPTFVPTQKDITPTSASVTQANAYADALKEKLSNPQNFAKNPYHYGKVSAYNADYDGANFARYARVSSTFKKHGFSPYRNNEAIYDKESSWWDYYKRSAGASFDLAKSSFNEALPWNAWDGKQSDMEAAVEMQRAHAIGHDNRGGAGSWINNMTLDSGYTMGMLGEFAAEEISMFVGSKANKALGKGSGPLVLGEAIGGTLQNLGKLVSSLRGYTKYDKIKDTYKYLSNTASWLKGGMKLSNFYDYAKTGAKWVGKQAMPESIDWMADMYKSGIGVRQGQLMVDMAKASKGFGAFYRDARLYSGVMSEAKVEGGSTELDVRDKLIDQYINANGGKQPDEKALQEIYRQAADAGRQTYLFNIPVLFLSNKIVFDKALRGFGPAAAFREELEKGLAGKLTYNEAWKKAGGKAWSVVEESFMDKLKAVKNFRTTFAPRNLYKNLVGKFATYTNANLTEGLQEMYQDAVSNTMKDYYTSNFYNPNVIGSRSFLGAFADNIGKTVTTTEGWSTFGSGFFMGSMVQFPQKLAFEIAPKKFNQIFRAEEYQKARDEEKIRTQKVVEALNEATMNENFWDSITENAGVQLNNQVEADKARSTNNKKAFYDITDESTYNHIHTLMTTGKLPLLKDMIDDFKRLDQNALQEAFGPVPPGEKSETYYQDKLNGMSRKLKLIEDNVQDIENRFGNPFNPGFYDPKKNPEEHAWEVASYNSWEKAKKAAAYSKYGFQRAVERMKSISERFGKDSAYGESAQSQFTMLLESDKVEREIDLLENEVKTYKESGDAKTKKQGEEKEEYLNFLKDYKTTLDAYAAAKQVNSYKEAGIQKEKVAESERQASIQKGTVVKDKNGKEHTVDYISKFNAYNSKGEKIGNLKNLEIVSGEVAPEEVSVLGNAEQMVREAYSNILKLRAKQMGINISEQSIEDSFNDMMDYQDLKHDAKDMALAVDMLHNPKGMLAYAKRYADLEKEAKKQNKENLEKAYTKFVDNLNVNDLFVELYKMDVFLDEAGMDAVIEKRVPSDFYSISKKERIPENSEKYKQIMDLIEKYEQARNMEFEEKPIEEADYTTAMLYATARRNKINNDTRTLKDFAKEFGFDVNLDSASKVKTKDVLKKIIDSPFATYREKALARRLLGLVKEESEITFKKLPTPGVFEYSDEAKIGVSIDPRYMSRDYRGGGTTAFEYVVLHELIHELTSFEMSKDAAFKAEITKLLQIARDEFENNPPTDQTLYKDGTKKPFYGLKNEQEFLSELFTNDRFAMWLDTIKVKGTGKSLWTEFKDALRRFLQRFLGVSKDSSLLDEALYIATTFIDKTQLGIEPQTTTTQTVAGTGQVLNLGSSIDEFEQAGLLPGLINAYKEFVKTQIGPDRTSASEWPDEFALEKTDDEIKRSKYFRDFLNLGLTSASKIIADHNDKVQRTKATRPSVTAKQPPVSTDTRTEIEKEKAAITASEFTELKRLAKFFLENPKEPTVAGSVVTKYPALFKAITDIETRKNYSINELGITEGVDKNIGGLYVSGKVDSNGAPITERITGSSVEDVTNKINAKYDAELAALEDASTKRPQIETAPSAALIAKGQRLGFTAEQLKAMTAEERDVVRQASSKEDVAELTAKYPPASSKETQAPSRTGTGPKASNAQKRILSRDLGYTDWVELNNMSSEEAQRLIDGNIIKSRRDQEAQREAEQAKLREAQSKEARMVEVEEMIARAGFKSEIEAIVNEAISADPLNVDSDRLDRAVETRLAQLALEVDFDDVRVNEALKLKSGGIVVVVEKTDNKLVVRKYGESPDSSTFDIKKSEFKNKVLYKDQPFVETLTKTDPEVEQQVQETSNENVATAQELNSTDSVREDIASAQNMTQEEVDDELINSLGCKR